MWPSIFPNGLLAGIPVKQLVFGLQEKNTLTMALSGKGLWGKNGLGPRARPQSSDRPAEE